MKPCRRLKFKIVGRSGSDHIRPILRSTIFASFYTDVIFPSLGKHSISHRSSYKFPLQLPRTTTNDLIAIGFQFELTNMLEPSANFDIMRFISMNYLLSSSFLPSNSFSGPKVSQLLGMGPRLTSALF